MVAEFADVARWRARRVMRYRADSHRLFSCLGFSEHVVFGARDGAWEAARKVAKHPWVERPRALGRDLPAFVECVRDAASTVAHEGGWLLDFGEEVSGFVELEVEAAGAVALRVAYAEHLIDGRVDAFKQGLRYFDGLDLPAGVTHWRSYEKRAFRFLHLSAPVHIEGGAIVRGCLRAKGRRGLRIEGYGVLDGSCFGQGDGEKGRKEQCILLEHCQEVVIEGLVLVEPSTWMVVLGCCRAVVVRNIKEIGEVVSSDGIDICGSTDVLVEGCMLKNNDDCVVFKSVGNWLGDVERVQVRNCVLLNDRAGNAMEIGFETCAARIGDIVFEDCDVLHVHGHGAPFSIHAGDRATIENVRWENIRVEHYYDKLVDFRVVEARYGRDKEKGRIRNIVLRNITVTKSPFNGGYSTAVIGGLDETHGVENVLFENFVLGGTKVRTPVEMDLYLRFAKDVRFQ